jgi:hypothetical protein
VLARLGGERRKMSIQDLNSALLYETERHNDEIAFAEKYSQAHAVPAGDILVEKLVQLLKTTRKVVPLARPAKQNKSRPTSLVSSLSEKE